MEAVIVTAPLTSQSTTGCYAQATRDCGGGSYQILDSESHAGGLFADILPGPVTWYTMSYTCGSSDGRLATFPQRSAFQGPVDNDLLAVWKHG
jgi:hypothetical protein